MATIATLIARIRQDLRDEDVLNQRWTDAHVQRHLERAIREYSIALPRQRKTAVATTAGSRDLSIAGLTDLVRVESVEWPAGQWPPAYVPFRIWDTTLTLLVDGTPSGENAMVSWLAVHPVDASTLPVRHEELIVRGAAGFAALEWSSYAINRVTTTGPGTAGEYRRWGELAVQEFRTGIDKRTVRGRRLKSEE